jgi:hypothetical protein
MHDETMRFFPVLCIMDTNQMVKRQGTSVGGVVFVVATAGRRK